MGSGLDLALSTVCQPRVKCLFSLLDRAQKLASVISAPPEPGESLNTHPENNHCWFLKQSFEGGRQNRHGCSYFTDRKTEAVGLVPWTNLTSDFHSSRGVAASDPGGVVAAVPSSVAGDALRSWASRMARLLDAGEASQEHLFPLRK